MNFKRSRGRAGKNETSLYLFGLHPESVMKITRKNAAKLVIRSL